ncbi:MAG: biotin carboxylase, partial [Rhodoferax sp.]|nr:biotin carboxylase [Rhodoferax sp.]
MLQIHAPLQALIVHWQVNTGDAVQTGDVVVILEAMKMEHEVRAPHAGRITELFFAPGALVAEGETLLNMKLVKHDSIASGPDLSQNMIEQADPSRPRPDLQRALDRHAPTLDANRPEAVAKRHSLGLRTARENIADLCDADSFLEYGALAVAAQSQRRSTEDLIKNTPADGMVTGVGSINQALFGPELSRAVVMAYDATVLAGTQGMRNHQKTDRML